MADVRAFTGLRLEPFGYSVWASGRQIAAGVGLDPTLWRRHEFDYTTRAWQKHGIALPKQ